MVKDVLSYKNLAVLYVLQVYTAFETLHFLVKAIWGATSKSLLLEYETFGKYNIFGENMGPLSATLIQREYFIIQTVNLCLGIQ